MYVRDELGDFSECAYSLLLSISFLLTHREAVTGYPAGHRLASFLSPWPIRRLHARHTACVSYVRAGGVSTLYIAPARREVWRVVNFYYLCPKETQEEKY